MSDQSRGFVGELHLKLADTLRRAEKFEQAVAPAAQAVKLLEEDVRRIEMTATAYYFQGLIFTSLEDASSSRASYIRSIELFDQSPQPNWDFVGVAAFNTGLSFLNIGEREQAEHFFGRAANAYSRLLSIWEQRSEQGLPVPPPEAVQDLRRRLADAQNRIMQLYYAAGDEPQQPNDI